MLCSWILISGVSSLRTGSLVFFHLNSIFNEECRKNFWLLNEKNALNVAMPLEDLMVLHFLLSEWQMANEWNGKIRHISRELIAQLFVSHRIVSFRSIPFGSILFIWHVKGNSSGSNTVRHDIDYWTHQNRNEFKRKPRVPTQGNHLYASHHTPATSFAMIATLM